jgi:hypothetical protein
MIERQLILSFCFFHCFEIILQLSTYISSDKKSLEELKSIIAFIHR